MKKDCNVFIYGKDEELKSLVEFKSGQIINHYQLRGREFTKVNVFKNNKKIESNKIKILFEEDCSLFPIILEGEFCCKIRKKGSYSLSPPKEEARLSLGNSEFDFFTINKNLVEQWLKKL